MISPKTFKKITQQILEPYEARDKKYKSALRKIRHANQISSSLVLVPLDKNRNAWLKMRWLLYDAASDLKGVQ